MNAAAIQATIGADATPLRESGPELENLAGQIGDKMEHRLFGARHLSGALATALGLNIEKLADKIDDIFGIGEKVRKQWEQIGEGSDKVTEKMIAANEARLSEEQKYQRTVQKRDDLERILAGRQESTLARQVEGDKLREQYADLLKETNTHERKEQKEADKKAAEQLKKFEEGAKEMGNAAYEELAIHLKTLPVKEQIRQLQNNIYVLQKLINSGSLEQTNTDQLSVQLAKLKKSELEAQGKLIEENIRKQKEYDDKHIAAAEVVDRYNYDQLSTEEKLARNQRVIAFADREISNSKTDIVAKAESIKAKEEAIAEIRRLTGLTEKEITLEMITQAQAAAKAAAAAEAQAAAAQKIKTIGRGDEQLSDKELQRKIRNIQSDIAARKNNAFNAPGDFAGSGYDMFLPVQEINLQQAISEMKFRQQVRTVANSAGKDAAFNMFSGLTEQKLNDILSTGTDFQAIIDQLKELNQNLLTGKTKIGTISIAS